MSAIWLSGGGEEAGEEHSFISTAKTKEALKAMLRSEETEAPGSDCTPRGYVSPGMTSLQRLISGSYACRHLMTSRICGGSPRDGGRFWQGPEEGQAESPPPGHTREALRAARLSGLESGVAAPLFPTRKGSRTAVAAVLTG